MAMEGGPGAMTGTCSICEQVKELPFQTPDDPPFYRGGNHCAACEHWLQTGEDIATHTKGTAQAHTHEDGGQP